VEHPVLLNGMQQRVDIAVFNRLGMPIMVVECKSADITLSNKTFAQAARYNLVLKAKYLVVTNGLSHFCSIIDFESKGFTPVAEVPKYGEIG
jgi:hypothetical protein